MSVTGSEAEPAPSLLLLKPDAFERDLVEDIAGLVASAGLTIEGRVRRTIDADVLLRLDHDCDRHRNPVTFLLNQRYLTRRPVEAWRVQGPDAVARALVVKALARQAFGESDLGNVVHAPGDQAEAVHQLDVLFPRGPDRGAPRERHGDPLALDPGFAALVYGALDRVDSLDGPPPSGDAALCGVILHDDGFLSADEVVAALERVPDASVEARVGWVYAAKRFGAVEVAACSLGEAARVGYGLNDAGLEITLRAAAGLGPLPGADGRAGGAAEPSVGIRPQAGRPSPRRPAGSPRPAARHTPGRPA